MADPEDKMDPDFEDFLKGLEDEEKDKQDAPAPTSEDGEDPRLPFEEEAPSPNTEEIPTPPPREPVPPPDTEAIPPGHPVQEMAWEETQEIPAPDFSAERDAPAPETGAPGEQTSMEDEMPVVPPPDESAPGYGEKAETMDPVPPAPQSPENVEQEAVNESQDMNIPVDDDEVDEALGYLLGYADDGSQPKSAEPRQLPPSSREFRPGRSESARFEKAATLSFQPIEEASIPKSAIADRDSAIFMHGTTHIDEYKRRQKKIPYSLIMVGAFAIIVILLILNILPSEGNDDTGIDNSYTIQRLNDAIETKNMELADKDARYQKKVAALKNEIDFLEKKIETKDALIVQAEENSGKFRSAAEKFEKDLVETRQKYMGLENSVQQQARKITELKSRNETLESSNKGLSERVEALVAQVDQLQKKLTEKKDARPSTTPLKPDETVKPDKTEGPGKTDTGKKDVLALLGAWTEAYNARNAEILAGFYAAANEFRKLYENGEEGRKAFAGHMDAAAGLSINIEPGEVTVSGDSAQAPVTVTFTGTENAPAPVKGVMKLVLENGAWKILEEGF